MKLIGALAVQHAKKKEQIGYSLIQIFTFDDKNPLYLLII